MDFVISPLRVIPPLPHKDPEINPRADFDFLPERLTRSDWPILFVKRNYLLAFFRGYNGSFENSLLGALSVPVKPAAAGAVRKSAQGATRRKGQVNDYKRSCRRNGDNGGDQKIHCKMRCSLHLNISNCAYLSQQGDSLSFSFSLSPRETTLRKRDRLLRANAARSIKSDHNNRE
jgi:hypothetical protein